MATQWYPATNETGVLGRFGYTEIPDIPASIEADEQKFKQIVVLWTKIVGSPEAGPPQKVLPQTKSDLIRRFPEAWKAFQGENIPQNGTAITEPFLGLDMPEPMVLLFQLNNVTSWEQIPALSDAQCQNMGFGVRKYRDDVMTRMGLPVVGKPPVTKPAGVAVSEEADSSPATSEQSAATAPARRPGRPRKNAA